MKKLVFILLAVLIAAAVFTRNTLPGEGGDAPVLYWATDPNPARVEQIAVFKKWLAKHHPEVVEKYGGIDIRVDTANSSPEKVLIQGVSGVAADLLDGSGGLRGRFNNSVGILEDLEEAGKAGGFSSDLTYSTILPEIQSLVKTSDDAGNVSYKMRQTSFPCNVFTEMLYVNLGAFEKYGIQPPPRRWTFDDFEKLGREIIAKANKPGEPQRVFVAIDMDPMTIMRSIGGSFFNETQTAPACDSEAVVHAYSLKRKWVKEKLLPSAADRDSFATSAGYGGSGLALFSQGNYAMLHGGRYHIIQLRKFNEELRAEGKPVIRYKIVEFPNGGMPVTPIFTRATAVYAAGKHKDLAKYFLEFLASREYNMKIVEDADSLPPIPGYAETDAFRNPPDHPEEHGCHEVFAESAAQIGIPSDFSPFVTESVVRRLADRAQEFILNDIKSPEEALADMRDGVAAEMKRCLREDPDLLPFYQERLEIQEKIEALRANDEKVPLSWISNPYFKAWYIHNGWADETK